MNFHINSYEIRTNTHELFHKGKAQKIEPLIFKLLIFMLKNPVRLLSRDELMNNVWESRVISDSALSASICAVRHAIGDTARKQQCIKTVSGHGYRFVAEVTQVKNTENTEILTKHKTTPPLTQQKADLQPFQHANTSRLLTTPYYELPPEEPLALPDKPSIAIMDFIDTGASQQGALLAYGLSTEINAALARLPHFFVIARASSAHLSTLQLVPKEISQRLGVRYLIYGNTEQLSKRIRVTISVVDATHNTEIWSEHFDRPLDDIFQVQDEITHTIISAIDSAIEQAEIERAFLTPTEDLSAWENYHRGLWHINLTTLKDIDKANCFFQKSIILDSRFSRAYAGLAYTHTSRKLLTGMAPANDINIKKSLDYAQLSIDYCRREPMGYMTMGRTLFFIKKYQQALLILNQGTQLTPNYSDCYFIKGTCYATLGHDTQAQLCLDHAERLSPFSPLQFSLKMARAVSLAHQKKYDEAVDCSLRATYYSNAYFSTYATATICLQLAGHTKQARQYANKTLKLKPDYSIELYQSLSPHADRSTRALFINALLNAGIPRVSTQHG